MTALEPPPPPPTPPVSCAAILSLNPAYTSGVYTIDPDGQGAFDVYCDMTTDGGGWTVFQRRKDGSVDFYRSYAEYANGFGTLTGEFWLGNNKIARLTNSGAPKLRIDMKRGAAGSNQASSATYNTFKVGNASTGYALTVGGFVDGVPSVGDSLSYHNGRQFSTFDNGPMTVCATSYHGAWWFNQCLMSDLNGQYYAGGSHASYATGINWYTWAGFYEGMVFTEMKVK